MASSLTLSTGLTAAQLQGMVTALTNEGGAEIRIYGGSTPSSANAGVGSAVLLATVKGPTSEALTLQVTGTVLEKDPLQVWTGNYIAAGTPTFFRLCAANDMGDASTTMPRLQGTVGRVDSDFNLSSIEAVVDQPVPIKEFIYSFREAVQG